MSDKRPGPVTRRLECYRLAVAWVGPMNSTPMVGPDAIRQHIGDVRMQHMDGMADYFHQRIYGGPLPPVEWVKQEEVTP